MRIKKKLVSVLTSAACIISMFSSFNLIASSENEYTYGFMKYKINKDASNNSYITIIDCDENVSGKLVIPSKIDGITVKEIGACENGAAFTYCSKITEVQIPSTVTTICNSAFYKCSSLTSVTIPGSVRTIDDNAFLGCSLKTIKLKYGLRSIGGAAFWGNPVENIDIPRSVNFIGGYAFHKCGYLTSVIIRNPDCEIEEDIVGSNVTIKGYSDSTAKTYAKTESLTFSSLGAAPVIVNGDVNSDGVANLYDVIMICQYLTKSINLSYEQQDRADFNGNEKVDLYDAIGIAKFILKK